MKRLLLAVFIFVIALASVETAVAFYDCVDKNGQRMITDNPPQGAKCKSMGGDEGSSPSGQKDGCDLITKGMSTVQVAKILGQPFNKEVGTSGFDTIYFDTWTYIKGDETCVVKFQCDSSCKVIKVTRN